MLKRSINQDVTILNVHVLSKKGSKYMKQKRTELKKGKNKEREREKEKWTHY